MKKSTKLGLGGIVFLLGTIVLSGCTASFCSVNDKAHIMYMYDHGVSLYNNEAGADGNRTLVRGFTNLYVEAVRPTDTQSGIYKADLAAQKAYISVPTDAFLRELDTTVLQHAVADYFNKTSFSAVTSEELNSIVAKYSNDTKAEAAPEGKIFIEDILKEKGYLKFADSITEKEKKKKTLVNYVAYVEETRALVAEENPVLTIDDLVSDDYISIYKTTMENIVAPYRSCIAIKDGEYGYYGYGDNDRIFEGGQGKVFLEGKDWGFAWTRGGAVLEGLLVYPIAWFTDFLTNAFMGVGAGWAQLLAILAVTVIVRGLLLLATMKSTTANAKMTALQPEIQKIQNKYPNANSNQYEKQRMAEEMQRLYKKNKINPFATIITLIIQFPVFICVWGGLQGAATLSSDAVLGLNLSMTIKDVLFNKVYWTAAGGYGAITALVLFLLMAATQVGSMLIPQIAQKRAAKAATKLGKNPSANESANKMKWFTWIMTAVIVFMGFTIASAMGVYWMVGGLFSMVQSLITQKVTAKNKR